MVQGSDGVDSSGLEELITSGGTLLQAASTWLELQHHLSPIETDRAVLLVGGMVSQRCAWQGSGAMQCNAPAGKGVQLAELCLQHLVELSNGGSDPGDASIDMDTPFFLAANASKACVPIRELSFRPPEVQRISPPEGLYPCPLDSMAACAASFSLAEAGGYLIRITGSGFGPARDESPSAVRIGNGTSSGAALFCAAVRVESDVELACILPPLLGFNYPVTVTVGGRTAAPQLISFRYPEIVAVAPSEILPSGRLGVQQQLVLDTVGFSTALLRNITIGGIICAVSEYSVTSSGGNVQCSIELPSAFDTGSSDGMVVAAYLALSMEAGAKASMV